MLPKYLNSIIYIRKGACQADKLESAERQWAGSPCDTTMNRPATLILHKLFSLSIKLIKKKNIVYLTKGGR